MGFTWNDKFYVEQVLSFALRTAPIIFNLFAEAWEWIVRSHLRWHLIEHYIDDMMAAFPNSQQKQLAQFKRDYSRLCDIPGILRQGRGRHNHQVYGQDGRLYNLYRLYSQRQGLSGHILTAHALASDSMTVHEAHQLAGLLSFCTTAASLALTLSPVVHNLPIDFRSVARC